MSGMAHFPDKIIGWMALLAILLSACGKNTQPSVQESDVLAERTLASDSISPLLPRKDSIRHLRLSAVGDIMMHNYQLRKAYRNDTDTFDFSPVFKQIQPYLDEADLLIGNLETPFGGKNKGHDTTIFGYGDFPYFNAPDCFAQTLAQAGFDWLTTANNHVLDAYPAAIPRTLNLLDSVGILHHGTFRDSSERERLCIIERNGIKVGFCAYTQSLNGLWLSQNQAYMVNEFRKFDSTKVSGIYETIHRLKAAGADFTVAYLHCGTEYQRNPNRYQRRLADSLHKIGCDLILMSHPHILQRMAVLSSKEGAHKSLVAYSLGNFLSGQVYSDSIPKDMGAILNVDIVKDSTGARISAVSVVPTYTYWRKKHIGILPLIEAYERGDSLMPLYQKDKVRIKDGYERTLKTLRGRMDSTLWSIGADRYRLQW